MARILSRKSQPALTEPQLAELRQLRDWARLLDSAFEIPGTNFRIGWDGLIGLIPGVGDLVTGLASAGIVARAAQLGAPRSLLMRMGVNVAVDVIIGAVPVFGDVFDMTWKANKRNVRLLERYFERLERQSPERSEGIATPGAGEPLGHRVPVQRG